MKNDPLYSAIVAVVESNETLIWSGKPDISCYQSHQRTENKKVIIGFNTLIVLVIATIMIRFGTSFVGIISFFVIIDLFFTLWLIQGIMSPSSHVNLYYGISDSQILYATINEGNIDVRRIPYHHLKKIHIHKYGCESHTITFVPHTLSGCVSCTFMCVPITENLEVIVKSVAPNVSWEFK